jgi:hypothetical protein
MGLSVLNSPYKGSTLCIEWRLLSFMRVNDNKKTGVAIKTKSIDMA